jgi:hypothetical protein
MQNMYIFRFHSVGSFRLFRLEFRILEKSRFLRPESRILEKPFTQKSIIKIKTGFVLLFYSKADLFIAQI